MESKLPNARRERKNRDACRKRTSASTVLPDGGLGRRGIAELVDSRFGRWPMAKTLGPRKVLFLEFNEITRAILDPMIRKGKLPNFRRLLAEGTTAAPESVD